MDDDQYSILEVSKQLEQRRTLTDQTEEKKGKTTAGFVPPSASTSPAPPTAPEDTTILVEEVLTTNTSEAPHTDLPSRRPEKRARSNIISETTPPEHSGELFEATPTGPQRESGVVFETLDGPIHTPTWRIDSKASSRFHETKSRVMLEPLLLPFDKFILEAEIKERDEDLAEVKKPT
ncbi:hypothetical protein AKJ16_DCAP19403 [Drosera capensis]